MKLVLSEHEQSQHENNQKENNEDALRLISKFRLVVLTALSPVDKQIIDAYKNPT